MGKPLGALEKLYEKQDCDGISVWVDAIIDQNALEEVKIGYRKLLFFGELTLHGIESKVFIR
jgi:hypothetical protein